MLRTHLHARPYTLDLTHWIKWLTLEDYTGLPVSGRGASIGISKKIEGCGGGTSKVRN